MPSATYGVVQVLEPFGRVVIMMRDPYVPAVGPLNRCE